MIKYRSGYRYQLVEDYQIFTDIIPVNTSGVPEGSGSDWVYISKSGLLIIQRGYAWDGPSGPTIDTPDSIRASLVHDGLYQLMRQGYLSTDYRLRSDEYLCSIAIEAGMFPPRAGYWFAGVRLGAQSAAMPKSERPVLVAP